MAEIDKGLPSNTRTEVKVPGEEQVDVQEEIVEKGPVEVTPEEDGGATIDFEPGAINIPGTENHFDNLADILPDDILEPIGNDMVQNFMDYKVSSTSIQRIITIRRTSKNTNYWSCISTCRATVYSCKRFYELFNYGSNERVRRRV